MKKLYIHCGTHKTGTTAIQKFLHQNRKSLEKNNIEYCNIGYTKNYPWNNHNIAWELCGDFRYDKNIPSVKEFINYLENKNENIILSSEDFQFNDIKNNYYKSFVNEINKKGYEIKVILYLRNQYDYLKGIYQIMLMIGHPYTNINEALNELESNKYFLKFKTITFFFDYNILIENIKESLNLNDNDIICKSYDENKNMLLKSFLNIFNIKETFDYEKYKNINSGLYQLSKDLIEKLNMSVKNINLTQEEFNKAKYALRYGEPFHIGEKFKINNNYVKNYIIKKFSLSNERIEKLFNIKINKWINEKN